MENPKILASKLISKETKLSESQILDLIEIPPDPKLGDLAFPCFSLSKDLKKSPQDIAKDLASKIKPSDIISEIRATGPYINFFLDNTKLSKQILSRILKEKNKYGSLKPNKQIYIIEFPSPNTNKPLHLGHLRNIALASSISKILENQGYTIKRINLNNDRGIHIMKSMLAYDIWGEGRTPNSEKIKSDHFVGDYYVLFSNKAKETPNLINQAQDLLLGWEQKDPNIRALWKKMNKWALDGFEQTYKRLGLKFDKTYFESDTYKGGKAIVEQGLNQGLFFKNEDGAVLADLSHENLGEKILLRPDGTSVYITQDLYLADLKYKDFKYNKSIYVAGSEQNYHFQVLFALLKALQKPYAEDCYHLNFELVYLPEGKMKSREGTVVDADDILDEMHEIAKMEVSARHDNISEKKLDQIAEKIGQAAIRFFLIKYSRNKAIIFNPKEAISFEGETGPYLQYALVRANKILAKQKLSKPDYSLLNSEEEIALIKKLAQFPEKIQESFKQYSPHILANYTIELSQQFNTFYEKCHVLKAESKDLKNARLSLVQAFTQTLKNALHLLNIEEVELM